MDTLPLPPDSSPLPPAPASAHREVVAAYDRITEADRPELWPTLRSLEDVLVDAKAVDDVGGLPLAGVLVAAADTIDLAGVPTAAGCPAFSRTPDVSAAAVRRLVEEGAVVLGKTAVGALGLAPGIDGAAEVVALGLVGAALTTTPPGRRDVVALTPTAGLLPSAGALTDRLTVVARTLAEGCRALDAMTDPAAWPHHVRLAAGEHPRLAIPDRDFLAALPPADQDAFRFAVRELLVAGVAVGTVDCTPFRDAAALTGNPALLAERHARAAGFLAEHPDALPGTVLPGRDLPAHRLAAAHQEVDEARARADAALAGYDALLVPLDAGSSALGWPEVTAAGVRILARPFDDQVVLDLAALLTGEQLKNPYPATRTALVVFGAHLRGQPLNHQLRGARFTGEVRTAPRYRMVALPDRQPGVLPCADGASLLGERWLISPGGLGRFLAALPAPMTLGAIELEDGDTAVGLLSQDAAAPDITAFTEWRAYLRHLSANRPGLG